MYEEDIKNIVKTIKNKRTEMGYSQQSIADQLGISQNMYSKIELNKTQISACKFLKICDLLQISPAEVLRNNKNKII